MSKYSLIVMILLAGAASVSHIASITPHGPCTDGRVGSPVVRPALAALRSVRHGFGGWYLTAAWPSSLACAASSFICA